MGTTGKNKTKTKSDTQDQHINALNLDNMDATSQRNAIRQLQQEMGQTGYEAGDPNAIPKRKLYVNTSKSFNINYYLSTGSIDSPSSNWQNLGYTERMVKNDINRIDSGMKPLSQALQTYRYVSGAALGRILNDTSFNDAKFVNNLISTLKSNQAALNNFNTILKNTKYTQQAYTSLSYVKKHTTYDSYPIRFNVLLREGTPSIITNNHAEHEVLAGRKLDYNFVGARIVNDYSYANRKHQDYLEINIVI